MILILFAIVVPVTTVTVWFGLSSYKQQLNSALHIERLANEASRNQVESELARLKAVLYSESDPLSFLLENKSGPEAIKNINTLLTLVIEREHAIREILILSKDGDVITGVDPAIAIPAGELLTASEASEFAQHWGLHNYNMVPEVVIPLSGRDYLGSPKSHEDYLYPIME